VRGFRAAPGPVVVIGAFPGVDSILPDCAIIETDPRPGEYPVAAMESLLPGCGGAIVNSSALINRSLTRILRLARHRAVALIGPSTPLTPRLHDYGLAVLGGFIARDARGLGEAVKAARRQRISPVSGAMSTSRTRLWRRAGAKQKPDAQASDAA
jgi:hypothetical protein